MSAAIVLLAAGSGTRVGAGMNKVFLPVGHSTVIGTSLSVALAVNDMARIVVVHHPDEHDDVAAALTPLLGDREIRLVPGGTTRHDSEWAAIQALRSDIEAGEIDVIAIHDAARPLASPALYSAVLAAARKVGGAIPVAVVPALITAESFTPVQSAVGVQTPQAFRATDLLSAYAAAEADGFRATDTAGTIAHYGDLRVAAVPSTSANLKVTFAEDVALADGLLSGRSAPQAS